MIVTFVGSVERTRTRLEDKGVNGISFHPRFGQSFSRDQTVPVISPTGNIDNRQRMDAVRRYNIRRACANLGPLKPRRVLLDHAMG